MPETDIKTSVSSIYFLPFVVVRLYTDNTLCDLCSDHTD